MSGIVSQAEQYGLPAREAGTLPDASEVADLLSTGPRIMAGMMKRRVAAERGMRQNTAWQQTPNYEPEQWVRSHGDRSVMVDDTTGMFPGEPPWTWSHYDTDVTANDPVYPNAFGRVPTREQAKQAAEEALAHPDPSGMWADMAHHGWEPRDQGNPATYKGDPAFARDRPTLRTHTAGFDGIETRHLLKQYRKPSIIDTDHGDELFEELHRRAEQGDRDAAREVLNDHDVDDPGWSYETGDFGG